MQGRYAEAVPIAKKVLQIYEKALGSDHPRVATSLTNLAFVLMRLGAYNQAEPFLKKALIIREKAFGLDHPDVAQSLNGLAGLYKSIGDYAKAEPLFKRALVILEKAVGSLHPDVARCLNNLGVLYLSIGDYSKAEPLLKRALAIRVRILDPNHPETADSFSNLASLYFNLGDYASAETLFKEALRLCEKKFGPEHPRVASYLGNLAELYKFLGDYVKAEPLYRRVLEIKRKALGPEHPEVALSLNNLATLYNLMGDYDRAEPLLKRALSIFMKALGPEHPDVALCLNNLATFYQTLGYYENVESFLKRSLAIREKAYGSRHPYVAESLSSLAGLYYLLGDRTRAKQIFKRALLILEKVLGGDHPDVARNLNNLAFLYAALGNFDEAHQLCKRAQAIDDKLIDQVMGFTSEDQKMKFLSNKSRHLHGFFSLISRHLIQDSTARKDAMDVWLRRKGVALEAQKRFQEALVYSDDPDAVKTFQELARVRSRLSKLTFSGPGKAEIEVYRKKIADFEKEKDRLQAKLSNLSRAFALKQKIAKADSEKVARALPSKTVLIDFARVGMFNFKAKGKDKKWLPDHYLAFVLHSGKEARVGLIDLGDAETIDRAVARFKKYILPRTDIKGSLAIKESRRIYDLVFNPLRKELGDVKEIFISPDGNLNLIPFEVLQGPDGRFLIEDYTFNYLASGRDVLGFGEIKQRGGKALIFGDPDYDMGSEEKQATLRKLALAPVGKQRVSKRSTEMRGFQFERLPGTKEEVEAIQGVLGKDRAELYTGKAAIEEVLKRKGAPRILHLATHGFFLRDLDLSQLIDDRSGRGTVLALKPKGMPKKGKAKRVKIENPLLRSGIALAGANNALKSGDRERSDGIVTAEKILGLRLRGTEMVVLSACETGMGEVKTGEGVFGLRRAFTQAGTRSLVMSMWSVPDKETRELMVQFYKNIRSGKMSRCRALRQAVLKEMKIIRERYENTNPFFWGAFVFLGEP
jgi:CHAT domain-containing protein/Tfp pilus assembly protein PilF